MGNRRGTEAVVLSGEPSVIGHVTKLHFSFKWFIALIHIIDNILSIAFGHVLYVLVVSLVAASFAQMLNHVDTPIYV